MPKLNQFSTYRFNVGWTVAYTAMPKEADNPRTEKERARYLGRAAVYRFCVSSVAMPSWSWYNLEASLGVLPLAFEVALLKILRKVGMEVKKTNIKAVKPAMEEVLGEGSMRDSEMPRRCGRGEHESPLQNKCKEWQDHLS